MAKTLYGIIAVLVLVAGIFYAGHTIGTQTEKAALQDRINTVDTARKIVDGKVKGFTPAERCVLLGGSLRNTGDCF